MQWRTSSNRLPKMRTSLWRDVYQTMASKRLEEDNRTMSELQVGLFLYPRGLKTRAKAKVSEIRPIFAQKIIAVDSSQLDALKESNKQQDEKIKSLEYQWDILAKERDQLKNMLQVHRQEKEDAAKEVVTLKAKLEEYYFLSVYSAQLL